ncbi:DUF294 nucleotidyltransferase-like domain-containing protein [Alicyclobacillus tolerans]|uniref:CBS domain-containing protein n=1 Tax=Alicyclobacillus tolerans TaxID=90970 RepID=A0ABT9LXZ1_9BACL|nr:DUF294 nucleotidyltransferase-like domain-containing protein [Alicyclobacillus tengchongensis]MDP9729134.1 CBS domain-containing protein [Alicyclobacillus tengchongensis]
MNEERNGGQELQKYLDAGDGSSFCKRAAILARQYAVEIPSASQFLQQFQLLRIQIIKRLWEECMPEELRSECQFVLLGASGRGEDFPFSDLDYALITKDGLWREKSLLFHLYQFQRRTYEYGFSPCPGNVMASNVRWRGDSKLWTTRTDAYFHYPDWKHARFLYMILDGKLLAEEGESSFWRLYQTSVLQRISQSSFLQWEMASLGIRGTVGKRPQSRKHWFGKQRQIGWNVKTELQTPIIRAIRLLYTRSVPFTNESVDKWAQITATKERLERIEKSGVISHDWSCHLRQAIEFASMLRLRAQSASYMAKGRASEEISMEDISLEEYQALQNHLHEAKKLEQFIVQHFRKPRGSA